MITTKVPPPVLPPNAWLRFDSIRGALRTAQPHAVLELGNGEGGLGAWLARQYDYTGVEPDPTSRATAELRLREVGRGRVLENRSDLSDDRFDLVCAFEVLEHIEDDLAALDEWGGYLQPEGWLLLSVPAHAAQYGPFDERAGHFRRYERADLTSRLEKTGYRVARFDSYGAGLGTVLQYGRNYLARRDAGGSTVEERTSASGRYFQPHAKFVALACATIAAPFRVAQRPFAGRDIGTGYVVLARRTT
ncbi:MAG TPA: class I SAM-dependent methyltransferase [Acidimicrobiia bacterium]|nr:class I SAM-dependent methyltransferase [Acidimicrobiia bacterium]